MQTEVLVPDGGTTVMGGVLADTEGETRQRTPGLASIPIVGNLFKRKLTTRQNSEILFFITPHIYRPDYQGRPTTSTVSNWTTNHHNFAASAVGQSAEQHANADAVATAANGAADHARHAQF